MTDWLSYPVTQGYNPSGGEYGVDIGTPFHTNITAPFLSGQSETGTVVNASYQPWGGQVGIQENLPGVGMVTEYIQHLDQIFVTVGQQITSGQLLGLSGGQNVGGSHPVSTQYSSGPHTEIGFNASWVSPTGSNFDPTSYLTGVGSGSGSGATSGVSGSSASQQGGIAGAICVLDPALCSASGIAGTAGAVAGAGAVSGLNQPGGTLADTLFGTGWQANLQDAGIKVGLVVFGAVAILLGLYIFVRNQ